MAGPGIRSYQFARELASEFRVALMAREGSDVDVADVELVTAPKHPAQLARALAGYDVVLAQLLPLATMRKLAASRARVIYDLYNLFLAEPLASFGVHPPTRAELLFARTADLGRRFSLLTGSAFVCASERQRDFWLGVLAAVGRVDADAYARDPTLRALVDVVPTGLTPERPRSDQRVLKGVFRGIRERDRVLLWAGGVWNWLDPLTVIRAVGRIAERRDDVKLVFLGLNAPNRVDRELAMARESVELARSAGLLDRTVFFNEGWTPYEERHAFLLEADIGVSAHFDILETRYAFRGRLLDHFWAGLPTISTRGDVLSDLVAARDLGRVVDFEDVEGWVAAIEALLAEPDARARIAPALAEVRAELEWPVAVRPLARLVSSAEAPQSRRGAASLALAEEALLRARTSAALGGPSSIARRQATKLAARRRS